MRTDEERIKGFEDMMPIGYTFPLDKDTIKSLNAGQLISYRSIASLKAGEGASEESYLICIKEMYHRLSQFDKMIATAKVYLKGV